MKRVRHAIKADLAGIVDVIRSTFPQDFDFGCGFSQTDCETLFSRAICDPFEFVAVLDSDKFGIIGFVYYVNKPPTNGTIILEMIGVKKEFQGRGFGARLLREADELVIANFANCRIATIHLTTGADNTAGQTLYLGVGYQPAGTIVGFVGDGNVEIFMLKKVSDVSYRQGLWAGKEK